MASGKFLPKNSECAGLKCTISHKSQPTNNRSLKCTNCCGLMTILASNANTKPAAEYAKKNKKKPKQTGHTPVDPNAQITTLPKRTSLLSVERMTSNLISTHAILIFFLIYWLILWLIF